MKNGVKAILLCLLCIVVVALCAGLGYSVYSEITGGTTNQETSSGDEEKTEDSASTEQSA